MDIFVKYNTPIFVYYCSNSSEIILNPKLIDIKFTDLFDAFTAFQEIEMFISGVLANNEKPLSIIDEKYRQQQRGFDKWSFRNPDPPKRKQKI